MDTFRLAGEPIGQTLADKLLGVEHSFTGVTTRAVQKARGEKAVEAAERLARIPGAGGDGVRKKDRLAGAAVVPVLTFGAEVHAPTKETIRKARAALAAEDIELKTVA